MSAALQGSLGLLGKPYTDLKWWGLVQTQKWSRWKRRCSLVQQAQCERDPKDSCSQYPGICSIFFFFYYVHTWFQGWTLGFEMNNLKNKRENNVLKLWNLQETFILMEKGVPVFKWWLSGLTMASLLGEQVFRPLKGFGHKCKVILDYLRSPLISSLMGPAWYTNTESTWTYRNIHYGPPFHTAVCSLDKKKN